jgi:hypothetical protein
MPLRISLALVMTVGACFGTKLFVADAHANAPLCQ